MSIYHNYCYQVTSTLSKADTFLGWTVGAGPDSVCLEKSRLYSKFQEKFRAESKWPNIVQTWLVWFHEILHKYLSKVSDCVQFRLKKWGQHKLYCH